MKFNIQSYNGILEDLKTKCVGHLATPRDADVWVWWQDCAGSYEDLAKANKELGLNKPLYVLQHGRGSTLDYGPPNSWPLYADKFMCWGKSDYDRLCSLGYKDRAVIVGCPLNTKIQPRIEHKEKIILFVPVNTGKEEPENIATYYELLKIKYEKAKIITLDNKEALKDKWSFNGKAVQFNTLASNFDVAAKLLPNHDRKLYHGNVISGFQDQAKNNELLFTLLRNVDLVVGLDEGTTEIFAYGHGIPVVVADGFQYRLWTKDGLSYKPTDTYKTRAATHTTLDGLKDAIEYQLAHPDYLRQERQEVAEEELGISYGNATNNIHRLIKREAKNTCNLQ